jgi:hypothetical protein
MFLHIEHFSTEFYLGILSENTSIALNTFCDTLCSHIKYVYKTVGCVPYYTRSRHGTASGII